MVAHEFKALTPFDGINKTGSSRLSIIQTSPQIPWPSSFFLSFFFKECQKPFLEKNENRRWPNHQICALGPCPNGCRRWRLPRQRQMAVHPRYFTFSPVLPCAQCPLPRVASFGCQPIAPCQAPNASCTASAEQEILQRL